MMNWFKYHSTAIIVLKDLLIFSNCISGSKFLEFFEYPKGLVNERVLYYVWNKMKIRFRNWWTPLYKGLKIVAGGFLIYYYWSVINNIIYYVYIFKHVQADRTVKTVTWLVKIPWCTSVIYMNKCACKSWSLIKVK